MKRLLLAAATALALSACASIEAPLICNVQEREAIVAENAYLLDRKKVIEQYAAGTLEIPGEGQSLVTRPVLVASYQRGYNARLDALVARSARFNQLCTSPS